uniref:Fatty acid hydroxylase domain-containing protein n=1 Tax=Plectus sambesii TaxID=2011161 RepID=A0A914W4A6_9BILA
MPTVAEYHRVADALDLFRLQSNMPTLREKKPFTRRVTLVYLRRTHSAFNTQNRQRHRGHEPSIGCIFRLRTPLFVRVPYGEAIACETVVALFYYSHRLLHHPRIYKHVHKVHHEWTAPIGIVSIYAHPFEHLVSNLLPPLVGPVLCGSHIATTWLWYTLALFSTTISHCGYHFPFLPSPESHDFHHLKFTQNYGVLGVFDRLHGTDNLFRSSKAYERHFMALSLVPVKEMYPNESKKDT